MGPGGGCVVSVREEGTSGHWAVGRGKGAAEVGLGGGPTLAVMRTPAPAAAAESGAGKADASLGLHNTLPDPDEGCWEGLPSAQAARCPVPWGHAGTLRERLGVTGPRPVWWGAQVLRQEHRSGPEARGARRPGWQGHNCRAPGGVRLWVTSAHPQLVNI